MTTEGDGVALHATRHPIEITEAMITAGEEAARDNIGFVEWHDDAGWHSTLRAVYTAMCDAAPPEPEIDEDSLVTTEVEIEIDEWRRTETEPVPDEYRDGVREILGISPAHIGKDGKPSSLILRWFKYNGLEAWRDWDNDPHFPTHWQPLHSRLCWFASS